MKECFVMNYEPLAKLYYKDKSVYTKSIMNASTMNFHIISPLK